MFQKVCPVLSRILTCFISVFLFTFGQAASAAVDEVVLAQLVRSGQSNIARQQLAASNPTQADILFLDALISKNERDFGKTILLLEQVLILKPNHLNARREKAHVLLLAGKYDLAERNIRELQRFDTGQGMANVYNTMLRSIQAGRPFGISGQFALLPSTNVNRGTFSTKINNNLTTGANSKATTGVGVQLGVNAYARMFLTDGSQNRVDVALTSTTYAARQFNSAVASVQFSHRRQLNPKTVVSFGPYWRFILSENDLWSEVTGIDEPDSDRRDYGFAANINRSVDAKTRVTAALKYEYQNYFYRPSETGHFVQGTLAATHSTSPSLRYSTGLQLSRSTAQRDDLQYRGIKLTTGVERIFKGGTVIGATVNLGTRNYDGAIAGFPTREDTFGGVSVSFQNNQLQFNGLTPRTTCTYSRNKSNIALYQNKITECYLGVTKRF
ncbi:MAG: surface lipoprotein assembly modifier [Planktomarina sp.]